MSSYILVFFFQAEDGIRDADVTGVQTCALPIFARRSVPFVTVAETVSAASNRAIAVSISCLVVSGTPYVMAPVAASKWLTGTPEQYVSAKKRYVYPARFSTSACPASFGIRAAYCAAVFSAEFRA